MIFVINYASFGATIFAKRCDNGQKYADPLKGIANETGLSLATVCRAENGNSCSLETYVALCQWLEMDLDSFVDEVTP